MKSGKMLAGVFHGINDLRIEEVPTPDLKTTKDVLVEVKACGLCGTDLGIIEGRRPTATLPPFIIGHEYAGIVVDTGTEVESVKAGDHVVVRPTIPCGKCYYCRVGKPGLCQSYMDIGVDIGDGGYAEYSLIPENNAYKIPSSMEWKDAVLIEPVSIVLHGIRSAQMQPGDVIVILGTGPIGLNWTAVAKRSGAGKVIISEPNEKRRMVAEELGADICINPLEQDPVEVVKDLTNGIGANIVVEAAGNPTTYRQAFKVAARGGKIVFVALPPSEFRIEISPYEIVIGEKHILGNWVNFFTFPAAISAMQNKMLPSDILFTHEFKLTDLPTALQLHKEGKSVKVLIKPR